MSSSLYLPYTKSVPSLYQVYGNKGVPPVYRQCTFGVPSSVLYCRHILPSLYPYPLGMP